MPAEIDITNSEQVRDALAAGILAGGAAVLVADASATAFCDCAGVRGLCQAHDRAAAAGTQLRVAASPPVRRILHLTGADRVLAVYHTFAEALDGEQPPALSNGHNRGPDRARAARPDYAT